MDDTADGREGRAGNTPDSRSWTRRGLLAGGAAAMVGLPGPSRAADRRGDPYGRNHAARTVTVGDFRLHASSTAWSLTGEARARR